MIDISYEKNPELYTDYLKGLKFLSEIKDEDYEYPEEKTIFHIFTEIKNDKELECIKSYLATQNLEKTKMIVWSLYDISDNPYIEPYKKYLDLRIYDANKESKGTLLENEIEKLSANDPKYYLQSDLMRLLILHKYGGVWVDMDIIFLRDFKPILDQEYMYQWGTGTNFGIIGACATVLSIKKDSEFSQQLLAELKERPIIPGSTVWGQYLFAKLWLRWPNFTIFPGSFFNTEWVMNEVDSCNLQAGWFFNNDIGGKHLFPEAFTWHWHNSSNKMKHVQPGSKFYNLREITNQKLQERGIL